MKALFFILTISCSHVYACNNNEKPNLELEMIYKAESQNKCTTYSLSLPNKYGSGGLDSVSLEYEGETIEMRVRLAIYPGIEDDTLISTRFCINQSWLTQSSIVATYHALPKVSDAGETSVPLCMDIYQYDNLKEYL